LSRRAAICILALVLAGCRRNAGPDANYRQAAALYQQLYATQLDDAYGDPQMDEVVELLHKVDSTSSDAHPAQMMLGAIERGREELAKQRAEREKMAARLPPTPVVNIDPEKVLAAGRDAGFPQDPFGPGGSVAELNTQSGGCLSDNEPFAEQDTGMTGTVYRLAPSEACKNRMPGLVGQAVLVVNGRIYRRMADPRPAAAPSPDAGSTAVARLPPAGSAAGADAGQHQSRIVHPGQPLPEGAGPAAQR
jgi:hypothetical protein